jgi:hypothetical protein
MSLQGGASPRDATERGHDVPARARMTAALARVPGWALLCAGVVGVFIVLALLGEALGRGPGGPPSSSYATGSQGLAAWAELEARAGHAVVQLRTPLERARLDPAATAVVLEPDALLASEGRRLVAFVRAGGWLVIGGGDPRGTLPALLSTLPGWRSSGSSAEIAVAREHPTSTDAHEVRSAGEGEWTTTAGYQRPFLSARGGALLLERELGRGRLELLADASPLQNRELGNADNAQLALNLAGAGRRPVVFAESVHGFGESRGLSALPDRWRLAFAGLALAGLLWALARGRRLGPAERQSARRAPPRSAYTEAISLLLRRTGDPDEIRAALTRLQDGP